VSLADVFANHPALTRRRDRWREGLQAAADALKPKPSARKAPRPELGLRLPILEFGFKYFRHRLEHAPSVLHREICGELDRIVASTESEADAFAAPRGNAKTTWISLIFVIYVIVYELKRYVIEITNESSLAVELVEDVAHELEDNEELAADFPHACGRGAVWKKGIGVIVTTNDVKLQGFGSGKKVRGRKHREHRPDLVIGDDLENDEQCRSREQRVKFRNWWNKAVMKMRGPGRKFDAIVAGTVMHFDSFLAGLLDPKISPGWRSRRYQSVIKWSPRTDLWEAWQALYTNYMKPDEVRQREAHGFFLEHRAEMLRDTEVLWPEGEPYYDLMKLRVNDGPVSFDSEKQNQPIDPETCFFREEWFLLFDVIDEGGERWLRPETGESVRVSECDAYGALDPSMGKKDKGSDPSALATILCHPAIRLDQGPYRTFWVVDCDIARRPPHEQEQKIYDSHKEHGYRRFGIETVQFQELFAENVREAIQEKPQLAGLNIAHLTPHTDKQLRIQGLENFIFSNRLRFNRKLSTLIRQFVFFGHDHDDGPDAVEQAMETAGAISFMVVRDPGGQGRAMADTKHPYDQQIRGAMPKAFEEKIGTCGKCVNFKRRGDGKEGRCEFHMFIVEADQIACPEGYVEDVD